MKLSFQGQKFLLANINARSELHGEEREPAGDLKLTSDVPNDVLSELHPSLKSALYHYDDARETDLADRGKRGEPGFLPHLRFRELEGPLKWSGEMLGAAVEIGVPGVRERIRLEACRVNGVQITPKDGGTVGFSIRIQCHPDERAFGRLCTLAQQEVEVWIVEDAADA